MQVTYFQRKPRPRANNFSIERVFEGVRRELPAHVDARLCVAPFYSNGLLRRISIAWHARRHKGQINHVTGDTNFTALALPGRRTILTNHDCGYLVRTRGLRHWLLKWIWLTLPVRHVAAVTTVSSYSKDEIVRYAGCPPEKIHVIPNPVNAEFQPSAKSFNAQRPRILHVGTTPNKNLPRLIEALAGRAGTLVIVGPIADDVRRLLDAAGIEHENYVDLTAAELLREYQACDIVAFVSLYEGFGMPILEAQAVGRPLITSARPPMSEIAGEGACLVDPTDSASIRSAFDRIVADASFRSALVAHGLENVKRYRPDAIARQYLAVYENVLRQT
jgi:glycosyltransferase involved in cell wall biosynthesis